jgi:hypothetical protein
MSLFGPPNVERLKAKENVKGLIRAADYPKDAAVRKAAAKALGGMVEPLIGKLRNENARVRKRAASALVTMYKSGKIDEKHKQLILAQRDKITAGHRDQSSHRDFPPQPHYDKDCTGAFGGVHNDRPARRSHVDQRSGAHTDQGIGIDFPL